MNFSYLKHQFLRLVGKSATANPEAWIYSWVLLGTAIGISMFAGLGWWLGSFASHPVTGMYLGLGWYGYWFTLNVEPMKAMADLKVQELKAFKALM